MGRYVMEEKNSSIDRNKNGQSVFKVNSQCNFNQIVELLDHCQKLTNVDEEICEFIDGKTIYKSYKYEFTPKGGDKLVDGLLVIYQREHNIYCLINQHTYAHVYLLQILEDIDNSIRFEAVKRECVNNDFLYWILSRIFYRKNEISILEDELFLDGLHLISGEVNKNRSAFGNISSDHSLPIDNLISTLAFIFERNIKSIGISLSYQNKDSKCCLLLSMNERGVIHTYYDSYSSTNMENNSREKCKVELYLLAELIILPLLLCKYNSDQNTLFNQSTYVWDAIAKNKFLDDVTDEIIKKVNEDRTSIENRNNRSIG